MSYQSLAAGDAAESFCQYGQSNLWFRGPPRTINEPYIACIGGAETFGRFVQRPFPAVLGARLNRPCINLGSLFCGAEALCQDPGLVQLANGAELCVLQFPDVLGQTNRFYRVHPHRNDRFVAPTQDLITLFPEVDFTEFHFVRHLISRLHTVSGPRFFEVKRELQHGWIRKLENFLSGISSPVIGLSLDIGSSRFGDGRCDNVPIEPFMIEALSAHCIDIFRLNLRVSGEADDLEDVLFGTLQQPMAEHMIGPSAHRSIATALSRAILDLQ